MSFRSWLRGQRARRLERTIAEQQARCPHPANARRVEPSPPLRHIRCGDCGAELDVQRWNELYGWRSVAGGMGKVEEGRCGEEGSNRGKGDR